ncbi:MAG: type II secretion system major pseudopilin GspG [Puniceicoccales bacterium]|nr:type II secretion system major pseudopilin GspG [Puniceicoccales bacterium]
MRSKKPLLFKRVRRAFTLVEMLIVIALLAVVAGAVVVNLDSIFGDAQVDVERQKVNSSLKMALTNYRLKMGSFPTTEQGLQALLTAPEGSADRWRGPYVEKAASLVDAWGSPYQYRCPGSHNTSGYDLWSLGPDKTDGTADDIGNWETGK